MFNDFIAYASKFISKEEILFVIIVAVSVTISLLLQKYYDEKIENELQRRRKEKENG